MADLFNIILSNIQETSLIEVIAVFFGILSVWFARKENILVFPTGIISVLLYVYICVSVKLYADMGINAFYFIMSVYGWYNWTHQNGKIEERSISRTTKKEKSMVAIALVIFFAILYYVLSKHTDSNVPIVDSLTTSIFLIAMWLMALKKVENWTFWIIGNLISIPLYISKDLMLTSFQFVIFLILAIMGLIEWRKRINNSIS